MSDHRFKVNLSGMIEILSDHLYSSPDVFIRELLQNAADAIVARKKHPSSTDGEWSEGSIYVFLENNTLRFVDNGIGLNENEIHQFLSIIGESSKKELNEETLRSDYIGKFGIGLLSCFMVSNEIVVKTRSAFCEKAYIWIGKPDGTYTLEEYDEPIEVGTQIILTPKEDSVSYFEFETVRDLLFHYGQILPYPIYFSDENNKIRINVPVLPWEKEVVDKKELLQYGFAMFKTVFFDCVVLKSEAGDATGVAYILPYQVQSSTRQSHLIYLKNMLLTEKGDDILPDWAFFTKCIINSGNLRPTASREGFYNDEILEQTRNELGGCIIDYLINLSRDNKMQFNRFMEIHELALRSIACANDEMFDTFIDVLSFHTTKGYLTGKQLRFMKEDLVFADLSEFKYLSQIFMAQNRLLIDAGYVYTLELLARLSDKYNLSLYKVDEEAVNDMLIDVSSSEAERCVDFLTIAEKTLEPYEVDVDIKQFIPADLPAFYFIDEDALLYQQMKETISLSDDLFSEILGDLASSVKKVNPTIYFNYNNPVIRNLINCEDAGLVSDIITVLYIQTLLMGDFRLRNNELGIMNIKLLNLFDRCI